MTCCDGYASNNTAVQSQKAVSAYFASKQILPFSFTEQNSNSCHMKCDTDINSLDFCVLQCLDDRRRLEAYTTFYLCCYDVSETAFDRKTPYLLRMPEWFRKWLTFKIHIAHQITSIFFIIYWLYIWMHDTKTLFYSNTNHTLTVNQTKATAVNIKVLMSDA